MSHKLLSLLVLSLTLVLGCSAGPNPEASSQDAGKPMPMPMTAGHSTLPPLHDTAYGACPYDYDPYDANRLYPVTTSSFSGGPFSTWDRLKYNDQVSLNIAEVAPAIKAVNCEFYYLICDLNDIQNYSKCKVDSTTLGVLPGRQKTNFTTSKLTNSPLINAALFNCDGCQSASITIEDTALAGALPIH
jgi:hypothetical protein